MKSQHVPKKSERKARNLSVLSSIVKKQVYWTQCDHEGLIQILGIFAGFHRRTWLSEASWCNVSEADFELEIVGFVDILFWYQCILYRYTKVLYHYQCSLRQNATRGPSYAET